MKSLILFLLFIILVPIALSSLLAMYILVKVADTVYLRKGDQCLSLRIRKSERQ